MEEETNLPRATMNSFVKEILGNEVKSSHEFTNIFNDCATEFIKVITAEANKICLNDGKKTISPEFIYKALKNLGFENYLKDIQMAENSFSEESNKKTKLRSKFNNIQNLAELEAEQQRLFQISRNYSLEMQNENQGNLNQNQQETHSQIQNINQNDQVFEKSDEEDYENY